MKSWQSCFLYYIILWGQKILFAISQAECPDRLTSCFPLREIPEQRERVYVDRAYPLGHAFGVKVHRVQKVQRVVVAASPQYIVCTVSEHLNARQWRRRRRRITGFSPKIRGPEGACCDF